MPRRARASFLLVCLLVACADPGSGDGADERSLDHDASVAAAGPPGTCSPAEVVSAVEAAYGL